MNVFSDEKKMINNSMIITFKYKYRINFIRMNCSSPSKSIFYSYDRSSKICIIISINTRLPQVFENNILILENKYSIKYIYIFIEFAIYILMYI